MVGTLSRITTLLLATGILLIGHGLQQTLLPVRAETAGWAVSLIGLMGSLYFVGFVVGCLMIPRVVAGVGHIRSFMVMTAVATAALLVAGLFVSPAVWFVLRFASGFALAGLYMVIESWLSEVSPAEQRGTVLGIYLAINLVGIAIGQLLLVAGSVESLELFALSATMMVLAIVPIGLTRVDSPAPPPPIEFTAQTLRKSSRVALVCAAAAGMVTSAFWMLGPILGRDFGLGAGQIGTMMACGVAGGALSQLPLGRLSDLTDRRTVIGCVAAVGVAVTIAGWFFAAGSAVSLFLFFFLFGAVTMPLYALCIVHACDLAEASLIEVTGSILIAHSAGSIVGPIVVAALMDGFGSRSFFVYSGVCLLLASAWALLRRVVVERPRTHSIHGPLLPRTTQGVAELLN